MSLLLVKTSALVLLSLNTVGLEEIGNKDGNKNGLNVAKLEDHGYHIGGLGRRERIVAM